MKQNYSELFEFLEEKTDQYNRASFIDSDPISIPHQFNRKEDIECIAFLIASIAWGNRKSIIANGNKLVQIMGESPYDFILHYKSKTHKKYIRNFVHRTFNPIDLDYFLRSLCNIYEKHNGLESAFNKASSAFSMKENIIEFRKLFFQLQHPERTKKHVSDPAENSAAKRINMFLRWMIRRDKRKVDFGLWNKIPMSALSCPLDLHSGNVARKLGLLSRTQNDWKAVSELDNTLRTFDPIDPVKYDFALFGLGVFEKF